MSTLEELRTEFVTTLEGAKAIVAAAQGAARDLEPDEKQQIEDAIAQAGVLKVEIDAKAKDASLATQLDTLGGSIGHGGGMATHMVARSLGATVTDDPAYKAWLDSYPNGRIPESAKGISSPALNVPHMGAMVGAHPGAKIVTSVADLSGNQRLIPPDNRGLVQSEYPWPTTETLDLIPKATTQSDTIHYARIGSVTNAAVVVPESATAAPDATPTTAEGFKPESDMTFTPATATVYTIAHWVAATKQALSDFGQLRALIDNFLLSGIKDKLVSYVLSGTGTNEPQGILTAAAANTTAFATDIVTTIRKAITTLATRGIKPNAVIMNPANTEALDLLQSSAGVYYFGNGPSGAPTAAPVWGLRRVDDPKMTSGFALVGDFSYTMLFDREQASVSASDSHADFFTRNLVAILGEMRAAFAVIRPDAFQIADIVTP